MKTNLQISLYLSLRNNDVSWNQSSTSIVDQTFRKASINRDAIHSEFLEWSPIPQNEL